MFYCNCAQYATGGTNSSTCSFFRQAVFWVDLDWLQWKPSLWITEKSAFVNSLEMCRIWIRSDSLRIRIWHVSNELIPISARKQSYEKLHVHAEMCKIGAFTNQQMHLGHHGCYVTTQSCMYGKVSCSAHNISHNDTWCFDLEKKAVVWVWLKLGVIAVISLTKNGRLFRTCIFVSVDIVFGIGQFGGHSRTRPFYTTLWLSVALLSGWFLGATGTLAMFFWQTAICT